MACEHCTELQLPLKLCSEDKPHPVDFVDGEIIYRRHNELGDEAVLKALPVNQIGNSIFRLNNDSYNRSSLSDPEDVLLNEFQSPEKGINYYANYGIVSIDISSIESIKHEIMLDNKERECILRVVHTVTACNYSHSEVFLYIDGQLYDGKAPKAATPFFRKELQKILKLVKQTVI